MTESCKNCLPCIPFQHYPVCLSFFGTKGKQEITGYAGTSDLWHHTIVPHLPVQWKRGTLTHRSLPKKPPRLLANLPWMRLYSVTHSDKIQLRASVKVKLAGDTDAMSPPRSEWQSGRFIFEHTLSHTEDLSTQSHGRNIYDTSMAARMWCLWEYWTFVDYTQDFSISWVNGF